MRLAMTLLVRDEADVVGDQLEYHLNAGVDFVLATDHDSVDGTTEILESYVRQGVLRRIPVAGEMRESPWRTAMARLAVTEHGADWVVNTDADEFWVARGGSLKEVLGAVPPRYGVVWALSRQFPPRPGAGPFAERMTVRVAAGAPISDPTSPYRPHAKVAHRADAEIVVRHGAHLVRSDRLEPLRDWYPADSLHFPFRSQEQYVRKCTRRAHLLGQYSRGTLASEEGKAQAVYGALVVSDDAVERGLASGCLAVDTRLRDGLRAIRIGEAVPVVAGRADVDVVADAASLREADLVRLQRSADGLAVRAAGLWRGSGRAARGMAE